MRTLQQTINWLFKAWSVLLFLVLVGIHVLLIEYLKFDPTITNKTISLLLQITGGLLVLYSIDSNLGVINGNRLYSLFTGWLKEFPILKRNFVIQIQGASHSHSTGAARLTVKSNPQTIEEKLAYLQTQIDEIKEDIGEQERELNNKITDLETLTVKEFQNSKSELHRLESKIEDVSVGGIQMQLFGVLLMIYGSITGYLA